MSSQVERKRALHSAELRRDCQGLSRTLSITQGRIPTAPPSGCAVEPWRWIRSVALLATSLHVRGDHAEELARQRDHVLLRVAARAELAVNRLREDRERPRITRSGAGIRIEGKCHWPPGIQGTCHGRLSVIPRNFDRNDIGDANGFAHFDCATCRKARNSIRTDPVLRASTRARALTRLFAGVS